MKALGGCIKDFNCKIGSTAVYGKISLLANISKNLLILKAASCQTAEHTDHAAHCFKRQKKAYN